jgi:hypothetical protein
MAARGRHAYLICLAVHLAFIVTVCCRDTFSALAETHAFSATALKWSEAEALSSVALGEQLSASNQYRQTVAAYLRCAGIEYGYGYFAPNVPDSFRLIFEIQYPDGRVESDVPTVSGHPFGLRLTTILENIGRISYQPLREMMIRMLTYAEWSEHPEATSIRAILGTVRLPSPAQFERGEDATYQPISSYEFRRRAQP